MGSGGPGDEDEVRLLRAQLADLSKRIDQLDNWGDPGGTAYLAVTVEVTSYPTTVGATFGLQIQDVFGADSEGAIPTFTTRPGTIFAAGIGQALPPQGSQVLVVETGIGRVFRYDPFPTECLVSTNETPSTTLKVVASAGLWVDNSGPTLETFTPSGSITLAASDTNYAYLDNSGNLTSNTTGFPTGFTATPLATVVTGASTVTSVKDARIQVYACGQAP